MKQRKEIAQQQKSTTTLTSLSDLKILSPDSDPQELSRPASRTASKRVLPLLPHWMKKKLTKLTELCDHCNTDHFAAKPWNHLLVLPLDHIHEVTFAIPDLFGSDKALRQEVDLIVEVYELLQLLYRKYRHPLTLVSLQTDDFGMYLPASFYCAEPDQLTLRDLSPAPAVHEPTIQDALLSLATRPQTTMSRLSAEVAQAARLMDEHDGIALRRAFSNKMRRLDRYYCRLMGRAKALSNDYHAELLWDNIDLYMNSSRVWGREFCIKWEIDEPLWKLNELHKLRPLIDLIILKTQSADFAFGVKAKGREVSCCNYVNAE